MSTETPSTKTPSPAAKPAPAPPAGALPDDALDRVAGGISGRAAPPVPALPTA